MLSVRIDGDGIAETFFFCLGKTVLQSGSFSFIDRMGNGADSRILFQNVGRIIRRAVIDDNDIVCIPAYLLNDCRQCLPVVVGGNNDDNLVPLVSSAKPMLCLYSSCFSVKLFRYVWDEYFRI